MHAIFSALEVTSHLTVTHSVDVGSGLLMHFKCISSAYMSIHTKTGVHVINFLPFSFIVWCLKLESDFGFQPRDKECLRK